MNHDDGIVADLRLHLGRRSPRCIRREGHQRAAVLVPLILEDGLQDLLLTERTDTVETHKGQISFPGGVADDADAGAAGTALREAAEELGILPSAVEVVGSLDDLVTPTGFVITPVVGVLRGLPALTPNRGEVASVFRVPLGFFADGANAVRSTRVMDGRKVEIWSYRWDRFTIWGATAWIIRSLLLVTGRI